MCAFHNKLIWQFIEVNIVKIIKNSVNRDYFIAKSTFFDIFTDTRSTSALNH